MKRNKTWILIFAITIMLASCSMARNMTASSAVEERLSLPAAEAPMADMEKGFDTGEGVNTDFASSSATDVNRIVIKNANLSIVVEDPIESMQDISDLAEGMGGFVVSSNSYKTTNNQGVEFPAASVTIRVPAEKLEEALTKIKAMVEDEDLDILSEDISGQDVTGEVTDLESRLRNLQAAEAQLLEIMDNADTTEDVVNIFRELTSIREEIEVIQGQIKYYRESASLSAVSINLQAKEAVAPISIAGWQPGLQAQRALQALVEGGKYLVNFLIWMLIFVLPFLAVIGLPIYFIVKAARKRKQTKTALEPAPKEKK
jgi:hypothetical protein